MSSLDFDAVAHTVKIAKRPGKVAAVVLNGCKWGSGLTGMAASAWGKFNSPSAPVCIG